MSDEREPIIDALLEELLGEQQPPDLTQRILGAYDAATDSTVDVRRLPEGSSARKSAVASTTESDSNDLGSKSNPTVAKRSKTTTSRRRRNMQAWASVAVILIGASGFFAWYQWSGSEINFNAVTSAPTSSANKPSDPARSAFVKANEPNTADDEAHNQEDFFPNAPNIEQEPLNAPSPQIAQPSSTIPGAGTETEFDFDPFASPEFQRELDLFEATPAANLIASINQDLQKVWRATSIEPMSSINDRQWFYRAVSFLFGRAPKQRELAWFQRSLDREEAVERMLASAQFDERWAKFFVNVLTGSSSNKRPVAENELHTYLFDSLREGKPYDQLAFELITAAGSNRPGPRDFNPATNFLLGHQQIEWTTPSRSEPLHKIGAMEKVSQVFLGMQTQCARCHDHNGLTQQQYYQLVSFFTQLNPIKPTDSSDVWRLSNVDYPGSNRKKESYDDADVFYTKMDIGGDDNQTGVSVYPEFLDGRKVPTKSGRVAVLNRREALAKFIVSSGQFPKALVNRVWDEAFGYGLTQPIEDMGDHNSPTHPELLETLATNFRNSGFDLKPLIKWIVLSKAFDRRSRAESDRLVGRPDAFSSFARLDRDLLYGDVSRALFVTSRALREGGLPNVNAQLGAGEEDGKLSPQKRARFQTRINAKKQFIKEHYGNLLTELSRNQDLTDLQRVIHVFLATVGRLPTQAERDRGIEIIKAKRNAELGMQEICLVILNSEEFVDQH